MTTPHALPLTELLSNVRKGDEDAVDQLITRVYPELRTIAARLLRDERPDHTLQPTALVHESFTRLFGSRAIGWKGRAHFFTIVATEMRRILVDYARARNAKKRAADPAAVVQAVMPSVSADQLLAIHDALIELEHLDPRAGRVVEFRFFAGLEEQEIAHALDISVATVKRDWRFARTWLFDHLSR
jgi:RNA polymerase sigma factor (TIGR02999 family)